jgi:hypothetical protein
VCQQAIIETKIVEKPVPVFCQVETSAECKEAYAVDRISPKDDSVTINRAFPPRTGRALGVRGEVLAAVKDRNQQPLKVVQ